MSDGYPAIGDYALISDCRSAALVSRAGSVDWCCVPRIDRASCFGRLLDWEHGGHCSLAPDGDFVAERRYLDRTLVLETTFRSGAGAARALDLLPIESDETGGGELMRIVEGIRGHVSFSLDVVARFDYGALKPWRRYHGMGLYSLTGGDDALLVSSEAKLEPVGAHDLHANFVVRAGERVRVSVRFVPPHRIDAEARAAPRADHLDSVAQATEEWWREWASRMRLQGDYAPGVLRSALVLKGLANRATGAIAAAPTTSLPESPGGSLNWDYRYSWIRDSAFSVRALADVGFVDEADAFRCFIERSTAGTGDKLQIMYGVGGERRLDEAVLDELEGYRGARPVRIGNAAAGQTQLDVYGELMELAWRWHERGHSPDDDYWRFLVDLVDHAVASWEQPDRGIWEIRGDPQHFVHSKVMCWAAADRGIRLAEDSLRQAPLKRWRHARDEIRRAVEEHGYDSDRGLFVQAFDTDALDAALLLLPGVGFLAWDDARMVRTADAIAADLDADGLLLRYRASRGAAEPEGAFLACSFWLAECFARQGRLPEARQVFDRSVAAGNDLALFSEEYDTKRDEPLGNFPQGLTHLAHVSAAVALAEDDGARLPR
ncbi:MAG: glycoside hydrolase family 15 protein [Chloroflexota bacterium]|nr:glycoside hydrolase family 15 protein [Chloroflexota bacterium]